MGKHSPIIILDKNRMTTNDTSDIYTVFLYNIFFLLGNLIHSHSCHYYLCNQWLINSIASPDLFHVYYFLYYSSTCLIHGQPTFFPKLSLLFIFAKSVTFIFPTFFFGLIITPLLKFSPFFTLHFQFIVNFYGPTTYIFLCISHLFISFCTSS